MKTKKTAAPKMQPAPGVGFDATPDGHGYGFKNEPSAVLCVHPIYGIRVHGPFVSLDAARAWERDESEESLVACYGSARGWSISATTLEVPTIYRRD